LLLVGKMEVGEMALTHWMKPFISQKRWQRNSIIYCDQRTVTYTENTCTQLDQLLVPGRFPAPKLCMYVGVARVYLALEIFKSIDDQNGNSHPYYIIYARTYRRYFRVLHLVEELGMSQQDAVD